jgi:hypothetical protein
VATALIMFVSYFLEKVLALLATITLEDAGPEFEYNYLDNLLIGPGSSKTRFEPICPCQSAGEYKYLLFQNSNISDCPLLCTHILKFKVVSQ